MRQNRLSASAAGRIALTLVALAAAASGAQHEEKAAARKHPFMTDVKAIEAGGRLFAIGCSVCHGSTGQGGRGPDLVQRSSWHALEDASLFKVIKEGVPAAGMPPSALGEDDLWRLAAYVRSLTLPAAQAQVAGKAEAGEALFWGKGGCGGCHRIRGRGGQLGPDLTNVGAERPLALLRESIVNPDASGLQSYRGIRVVRKDGTTVAGVARNRSNYSLQVQSADGTVHLIPVGDVRELELSAHSPMPRDYATRFTRQEIDDLLAHLSRQHLRPTEPLGAPENP